MSTGVGVEAIIDFCRWAMGVLESGFVIWWEFFKSAIVPLTAAGAAAGVVIQQIRQSDQSRREDRRANGVKAAVAALTEAAVYPLDPAATPVRLLENNRNMVEMYSLLQGDDLPVARWVAKINAQLVESGVAWRDNIAALSRVDPIAARTALYSQVGPDRAAISRTATEAIDTLLSWQHGRIPTSHFDS